MKTTLTVRDISQLDFSKELLEMNIAEALQVAEERRKALLAIKYAIEEGICYDETIDEIENILKGVGIDVNKENM